MAKNSSMAPPPPVPFREVEGIPFVNKPYLGNVNTMGPTPEDIPEEDEARANYYRALKGEPHPGNVKDANDRAKAGREQEAQLKAAGRDAEPPPTPRTAADASMEDIKRRAEEKAKEQPPRVIDDDRGRGRD